MRHISSHLLLTPSGLFPNRVVTVSAEGVITDISTSPHLDREAGVEFYPGILIPGFVNAHCHLELSHLRGAIPPGGGFTAFARGMRAVRSEELRVKSEELKRPATSPSHSEGTPPSGRRRKLTQNMCRVAFPSFGKEGWQASPDGVVGFWEAKMWAEGVSAVADVCNGDTTFEVKRHSRIKYQNFCELFGLHSHPAKVFALRDEALAAGLTASVTPHSLYSLNRENFASAVTLHSYLPRKMPPPPSATVGTRSVSLASSMLVSLITLHFLESADEIELFKKHGAMWDWYAEQGLTPDFLDYGSPAERLVAQTPPDRSVLLVHNCAVTQRDIDIVMGHFTAPVTWVLCPGSNRYISGAEPPVELLRKNGLQIAVGTDSLASNETLSMVRELGMIKNVPLAELLGWATANGARALGMDDTLGTIEVGKSPGLVLLTGVDMQTLTLTENARTERII